MANGLCDASSLAFFFSLKVPQHYFLPLQYPVYPLFRLLSPALWGSQSSPFLVALAFPPFLLLARAYVRAPSDFFPVFTHRSFFPFRNIIGGAMHLSPFPSPPSGPLPLARPLLMAKTVRPRSLTPRVRLRRIPGRVPATC